MVGPLTLEIVELIYHCKQSKPSDAASLLKLQPPNSASFLAGASFHSFSLPSVVLTTPTIRTSLRMGLPSKGRMAEDTQELLKECALSVYKPNPRQYIATIPQVRGWNT